MRRLAHTSDASVGRRLKIGDVAKRSGVSVDALRFYERQGLLDAASRTESGYRLYDDDVLEQLDFIRRAQTLGFSLGEIARIVDEKRRGQSPCAEVRAIVRARLEDVDARLAELKRYRKELAATLAEWEATGDVDGHVCGLIEGTTLSASHPDVGPMASKRRR